MAAQSLSISDMFELMRRNMVPVVVIMLICIGVAVGALSLMSPRYKSKSVLNIEPAYFQTAMVGDLLPQVSDSAEQSVARASLLRMALSESFIDSLGEEFHVYKRSADDPFRPVEREALLKSIEYFPQSSTAYEIGVLATVPRTAYEMNKRILAHMIVKLTEDRHQTLVRTRDSIATYLKSLTVALKETGGLGASKRPESIRAELEKIDSDIKTLSAQYSPTHPQVLDLKRQAQSLRMALSLTNGGVQKNDSTTLTGAAAKNANQETYDELVKKLNYLNIVVEMETDKGDLPSLAVLEQPSMPIYPIYPPKVKILLLGFAAGMFLSAALVAFLELRRGTFLAPIGAAGALGVPLLGEMPRLRTIDQSRVPLIPGPGEFAVRERLPEVIKEE